MNTSLIAVTSGLTHPDSTDQSVLRENGWQTFHSISIDGSPDGQRWFAMVDAFAVGVAAITERDGVAIDTAGRPRRAVGTVIGIDSQEDFVAGQGRSLVCIWYQIPRESQLEFENWFATEHAPMILEEPALRRTSRLRIVRIEGFERAWTHLVVHELTGLEALSAPAFAAAQDAPGRRALLHLDWFNDRDTGFFAPDV